jgi:hypothetical protein
MAASFIFKGPLKVISKPPAENARSAGKRPFSDLHGHFHDHAPKPSTKEHLASHP